MKTDGDGKLADGQVKIDELKESMTADKQMREKQAMYEFKLMEWRDACRVL